MRMAEIERKRQELKRQMEEATKERRAKKSFMTPDRKKKLRLLLRRKAAEELKKEQERKAEERRWTIEERCGEPEDIEWSNKEDLIDICEYYYQRILDIESKKWDIELEIRRKHYEIVDINSKVNDLRGKFQKPILRKVSRYENKFAKLQKKAAEYNYRNQLRLVKRHEFTLKEDDRKGRLGDRRSESREVDSKRDELSEAETETIPDGEVRDDESSIAEVEERLEAVREDFLLESGVPTIEEEGHLETNESVEEEQKSIESSAVRPLEGDRLDDEEVEAQLQGDETLEGELRFEGEEKVDGEAKLGEEVTLDGDVRLEEQIKFDGEVRLEEQITLDGESRLEGEVTMDEGTRLEDPEFHDEEEVLPPETPPLEHTEEDLWSYLRENVSSVHPSTVDEFVQNLIGTLQHVPKEYLQPVIEANIKRATSPSVTDGEHPSSPEGYRQDEVSEEVNQSRNQEDYSDPSQTQGTFEEDFPAPTQEVSSDISATD